MHTIKASVLCRKNRYEVTLDRDSNQLLGDPLMFTGHTEVVALDALQSYVADQGLATEIVVVKRQGLEHSAQEGAYLAYRSKGGDMPLSIYLEG